ncbi:MAG: family 10 glycosylhydrolase [Saprospiraceae bacterium]|nr:family 10 glycosylhydrolase [Saprospiraceae bacterium]
MNIDYPSVPTTDEAALRQNWLNILAKHKATGINALFVQVRPCGDALYKSELVPWSSYLTGRAGVAPNNDFDPLSFMIETAHQMGFEFHAWLNPYRTSMDNQTPNSFSENHVMRQHPEWCVKYGKRYILNPGLPDVRTHVLQVVEEIVRKYDVDGIHLDDYFYPYKIAGESFPDWQAFQQFNDGYTNIDDWRRYNVDMLIYGMAKGIKKIKPRVQFGVSPFGVWRNKSKDPEGSATQAGLTCYDDLYADVRKWCREKWIDYVVPQVYWQMGFAIAEHKTIVDWWSDNADGVPIYVGHGVYRLGQGSGREPAWSDRREIGRQIINARNTQGVRGSVFFSSKQLVANLLSIADSLRENYYASPALPPVIVRDTSFLQCDAPEIRQIMAENGSVRIRWQPSRATEKRHPFQYVVYRFPMGRVDFTDGRNILALVPHDSQDLTWIDIDVQNEETYLYAVTVVDCNNEETPPTDLIAVNEAVTNDSADTILTTQKSSMSKEKKKKRCGFFRRLFGKCDKG